MAASKELQIIGTTFALNETPLPKKTLQLV